MNQLKKLSCSIALVNICGKPFEKDVIQTLYELFDQFKTEYSSYYVQYFYYPQSFDHKKLDKFKSKFKNYEQFVKFVPMNEFHVRSIWYVIVTDDEMKANVNMSNRSFCVLKKVTKQSVTHALLNFYVKASLLTQINANKVGKK